MKKIFENIKSYLDLYLILLSWSVVGAVAPEVVAIVWSVATFMLVLRTEDRTKIIFALITMLVFSDSRMRMFNFAETAKIGVVVLLFIHVIRNFGSYNAYNNRIFKYFLPFLVFSIIATLWATLTFTAFQKSVSYAMIYFTVPLVFLKALDENPRFGIDFAILVTMLLGIGLGLYYLNPESMTLAGRYHGLMGNPNGLGVLQIVMFPLCYLYWRSRRHQENLTQLALIFVVVFLASLLLTGSRTALFALILFFVFSRLRYFSNVATILGFLVLIVSYEFILQQLPMIITSLGLQDYMRLETLREGSGRNVAWAFAWRMIDDVFFVGGGFSHTEFIFGQHSEYLSRLGHQGNAHNSYLTLWLDTGIVGIVLFVFGLLRTIISAVRTNAFTLPIVYALLFSTYYESWLAASLNPFTSIFLMTLAFLAREEEAEEVPENSMSNEKDQELKLSMGNT